MRRVWLGIGLLVGLLAFGVFVTVGIHRICAPISEQLEQAAQAASAEEALPLCQAARRRWETYRQLTAAVTDHEPMEEIDALYEELEAYAQWGDQKRFAQCCARLASQTRAIAEAQAVNWWNIF